MAHVLSLTGLEARVIQLETAQSALPTRQNVSERLGTFNDDLLVLDDTDLTQSDSIDRLREALRALNVSIFNHVDLFVDHTGDNPFGHHVIAEEDPFFVSFEDWDGHTGDADAHHAQVAQTGLVTIVHFESHSGMSYNNAHPTQAFWGGWGSSNFTVGLAYGVISTPELLTRSSSGDVAQISPELEIYYPGVYVIDGNIGYENRDVGNDPSGLGQTALELVGQGLLTGCNGNTAWSSALPVVQQATANSSARQVVRLNSGDVLRLTKRKVYNMNVRAAANGSSLSIWRIGD